mmetsp:Transcript_12278/g.51647  ORF Transcript_12278/g.51647 Transcript_12278/m.51647 type:complete len:236 (-) Transcript_12278:915-1622(-)
MRASAYEHGSSGYHAGYDATGRVGWGVQRVAARALVRPLPPPTRAFHNRRKTWAMTKSEICRDTCPDMRIAADLCTEFSLELLRKWSVATKNDETHDNNPSPSGAHRGRQCVISRQFGLFICHGLFIRSVTHRGRRRLPGFLELLPREPRKLPQVLLAPDLPDLRQYLHVASRRAQVDSPTPHDGDSVRRFIRHLLHRRRRHGLRRAHPLAVHPRRPHVPAEPFGVLPPFERDRV